VTTADILADWYRQHRRPLPWRETRDPYLVWVSETILQQTRVAQGLEYYQRFVARFPDVTALAAAPEDEVLKYWQGLGYYTRARNLLAAARDIVDRRGGVFPDTHAGVRSLKGVGDYTAAAICSFALGVPRAVVDGNVYRVLARLHGVEMAADTGEGRRYFAALAAELLPTRSHDVHNQAIMEFGALQCVPRSPDCPVCPLADRCVALATRRVDALPVKKAKPTLKHRYFNYLHVTGNGMTLLAKREERDIWRNLHEFPVIETDRPVEFDELCLHPRFRELLSGATLARVEINVMSRRHLLTHRVIHARFHRLDVSEFSPAMRVYLLVPDADLDSYAVHRLVQGYLEERQ
jgi:A/G-specific adenine glycosylase